MNRARRLLTLAFMAHQRGEDAIAARIATLAFEDAGASSVFSELGEITTASEEGDIQVRKAEAVLRKAEATVTTGSLFTEEGVAKLLAIAEKVHKSGFPKVAKSINRVAS